MDLNIIDDLDKRILRTLEVNAGISNLDLAERVHASPATCLRRVGRLKESGVVQVVVALLDPAKIGVGLTAVIEVTLDRQDAESLDQFQQTATKDEAVRQCYRVAGGIDFMLVAYLGDMDAYHALAHRLLSNQINVRNVRTMFSTHCAKFDTRRMPAVS